MLKKTGMEATKLIIDVQYILGWFLNTVISGDAYVSQWTGSDLLSTEAFQIKFYEILHHNVEILKMWKF